MSIRIKDFVGVQATLKLLDSAATYDGWVASIEHGSVTIRADGFPLMLPGTQVQIELCGKDNVACFGATFVNTLAVNYDIAIVKRNVQNDIGVEIVLDQIEYKFFVSSEIQFKSPTGFFRVDAEGLFMTAQLDGKQVDFEMKDVSQSSFTAMCEREVEVGLAFECKVQGLRTCIIGAAKIHACKALIAGKQYLIEAEFDPSGRIDAGRWRNLIENPKAA